MSAPTARIASGDRVRVFPASGDHAFPAKVTDLGAWGPTLLIGTRLVFMPWAAIDRLEQTNPCDVGGCVLEREHRDEHRTAAGEVIGVAPEKAEWCTVKTLVGDEDGGISTLECDRPARHEGRHASTIDGRRVSWRAR